MKWINIALCLTCVAFLGWISCDHFAHQGDHLNDVEVYVPPVNDAPLVVSADRLASAFGGSSSENARVIAPHVNGVSPEIINAMHRHQEILAEARRINAQPMRMVRMPESDSSHTASSSSNRSTRQRLGFAKPRSVFVRSRRYEEFGSNYSKNGRNRVSPSRRSGRNRY